MSTRSDNRNQADIPPTHTVKPMDAPPLTEGSTTAQLKGDIDSGRTGDKNAVFDPALSPLGTDDEAAGTPPTREQVAMAARQELRPNRRRVDANRQAIEGFPWPYVAIVVPLMAVILFVLSLALQQRV